MSRRRRPELDDDVPRLPRGRGIKLSTGEILRIAMTAIFLIAVLMLGRPCANAVGSFVGGFDPPDAQPAPAVPPGYVHLGPGMSQKEIEAAVAAARDAQLRAPLPGDAGVGSASGAP